MAKKYFLVASLLFQVVYSCAQPDSQYSGWIEKAMNFYESKDYTKSAEAFTHAFAANGGKGAPDDRYNAACSWSLAGNKDSAFFQLKKLAGKGNFSDLTHLGGDSDLINLHNDKRWNQICLLVKKNKEKAERHFNKPLVATLDTIYQDDQDLRMQAIDVQKKYGSNSKEMTDLWHRIEERDSVNLIKVERILDKYGWLGSKIIGGKGNATLFLVIQHADIKVQEKYLPVMRNAVKNKNADPADLALLEDRVALREGRRQIYGSQVRGDVSGNYWLSPLEDPDNVDKRRAKVGLPPIATYLQQWNIKWNVEEYKKNLPDIEKKEKIN